MKTELEKLKFVDLHRHSEYSLLDGSIKIKDMVDNTYYAGALTDHGNMFGHLKYYKEMKRQGKIPIIGIEGYMTSINGAKDRNHIILLCKNQTGYKNLSELTSSSYNTENFYYKPHITWEALETHSQGLICLSACMGGELAKSVLKRDDALSRQIIERFLNIFHDDFYIEVQRHFIENENYLNNRLIELAKEYNIKVVATTDAHYLKKEDAKVHEILLAMQTKSTLQDKNRFKFKGQNYHLQSQKEMQLLWSDHPEFLTNTLEVLEKCRNFKIELDKIYMPKFKIPKEFPSEKDYLRVLIWQGLKAKRLENNQQYIERIIKELTIIDNMGFTGYFLIVQDFINYAKKQGIAVGPGRGSAGGSLICYLIGITEIDPIKNDLIFERFLNPNRVSMPDIDVDFADSNREDVIEYVKHKYGVDKVSNIITFGTMGARMILRDVTRTLDKPYWLGDKLAKMVPERPGITLKEALAESPELTNFINGNSDAKKILEYSMKLEGLPRHASQHACFVAGSKVSMEDGEKNIEDVKVGDYVLTHKNRYKKVVDTMKKRVKTLMSITPDLYFRTITCTPDHPFLTCRVIDGKPLVQKLTEPVWKEAKDINVEEDLLCIPLTGRKGTIGWWLDTRNILFVRGNNYSTDGCVWIRPRKICVEQLAHKEDVYNLTVEDDSSYVVNGIAVHNCGVIISSEKIQKIIPEAIVGPKDNKARVTQVTMTECEDLGLLKMDFLGLRTMTVIQKSLAEINKKTGQNLKLGDIPIYDRSMYTLIAQGKNEGLFQIESEGMVSFLRELFGDIWEGEVKGRELFDRLVAGISLYRPGPMEYIPDYIKGMRSPARVKYDHDKLRPILRKTYGQIVYQEQVMQIAVELAGYSMAQADNLRRAMGGVLPSQFN